MKKLKNINIKKQDGHSPVRQGADLQQSMCKGPGFPWAKYQGEYHLPCK